MPAQEEGVSTSNLMGALLGRARARDRTAFDELVAPYRGELEVHCYRILGSLTDAEDALQDSLVAAWEAMGGFRGDASLRTWLYRVTTRRCLNVLRSSRRRSPRNAASMGVELPPPTRLGEIVWLEPYPDTRLDQIPDTSAGPEARYERREAISLAFITALQLLQPGPRAVLILRDVLDFSAQETADVLGTTTHSVNSALRRARAKLADELPDPEQVSPARSSAEERELLDRLVLAWESGDLRALLSLLTDDVWLRMPPAPFEYEGLEQAARWFATVVFRDDRRFRLAPVMANRQPGFALYVRGSQSEVEQAEGIVVSPSRAGASER